MSLGLSLISELTTVFVSSFLLHVAGAIGRLLPGGKGCNQLWIQPVDLARVQIEQTGRSPNRSTNLTR